MALFGRELLDGEEDFDFMIRRLANELLPAGTGVREVDGDALVIGGITTTLSNLRRAWVEQPVEDRLPWLERTVGAFVAHEPIPSDLDPTRVRPAVHSLSRLGLAGLREMVAAPAAVASPIPHAPIAGDLAWTVVWDTPATMDLIEQDTLEAWGTSFEELLGRAKLNLAMQPFLGWEVIEGRIFAPRGVDDYDAARILLPGQLDFLPFDSERVVFVPSRSNCAVVSADDELAIAAAADHALDHVGAANRVSLPPIIGHGTNWRPLVLADDHPAFNSWSRLVTYDRAASYETQLALLTSVIGDDVLVGRFEPFERAGGALSSYCTWARGVEALLPAADNIAFTEDGSEPFLVAWDAVREVCAELMEPTGHQPVRWRVRGYPSDAELAILRGLSATS